MHKLFLGLAFVAQRLHPPFDRYSKMFAEPMPFGAGPRYHFMRTKTIERRT
jgi:hypothetical protein